MSAQMYSSGYLLKSLSFVSSEKKPPKIKAGNVSNSNT